MYTFYLIYPAVSVTILHTQQIICIKKAHYITFSYVKNQLNASTHGVWINGVITVCSILGEKNCHCVVLFLPDKKRGKNNDWGQFVIGTASA